MAIQLTAGLLSEMIDEELAKYLVEKEGCKGNPLHRYKDGRFTSKKTRGSYSLDKSKIPASCDRPTGQHSRRKGSDKPQQNKKPCGRKDRRKRCRGGNGNIKEQDNTDTLLGTDDNKNRPNSLEPARTGVERPQIPLDTPNYLRTGLKPTQDILGRLEGKKKIVAKLGLTTQELAELMNVLVDTISDKMSSAGK
jgi:hypothetical protein